MRNKLKLINTVILILIFICQYSSTDAKIIKNKLLVSINDEIITSIDIKDELKYLKILKVINTDKLSKPDAESLVLSQMIKDKIKNIEISKYMQNEIEEEKYNIYILDIANNLGYESIEGLKKYLKKEKLDFEIIKKKIINELKWNNLIYSYYKNQININKKNIDKKLQIILKKENPKEFFISEILIQENNIENINGTIKKIKDYIEKFGFENAAVKYSVSQSSKRGGKIGWINDNQISEKFLLEIEKIDIGEITNPIDVSAGIILLKLNDKREIEKQIDKKKILQNLLQTEQNRQLNIFSIKHYIMVKNNLTIKYFNE